MLMRNLLGKSLLICKYMSHIYKYTCISTLSAHKRKYMHTSLLSFHMQTWLASCCTKRIIVLFSNSPHDVFGDKLKQSIVYIHSCRLFVYFNECMLLPLLFIDQILNDFSLLQFSCPILLLKQN